MDNMDQSDENGNMDEMDETMDEGRATIAKPKSNGRLATPPRMMVNGSGDNSAQDGNQRPALLITSTSTPSANGASVLNNNAADTSSIDSEATTLNDRRRQPSGERRQTLPERRNFMCAPLSAPHDAQRKFSAFYDQQHHGGGVPMRKTSAPTRPSDFPTAFGDGAGGSVAKVPRSRTRASESANPFESGDGFNRDTVPKDSNNRSPTESDDRLRDTETVVQSFMTAAYLREQTKAVTESDDETPLAAEGGAAASAVILPGLDVTTTPDLPPELQSAPLSPTAQVGRRLALLADEFDERYRSELDDMAHTVLPYILGKATGGRGEGEPSTTTSGWTLTFEAFQKVARKLFDKSQITWGRIIALLCFGYRLMLAVLRANLPGFIRNIVRLVSRFIEVEPIANWIELQGGWLNAIFFESANAGSRQRAIAEVGFWSVQMIAGVLLVWGLWRGGE